MSAPSPRALWRAVTGQDAPAELPPAGDLTGLVAALVDAGWSADAVREHARATADEGLPWPHPIPRDQRGDAGPAQWAASVQHLCERLGVDATVVQAPSTRTILTADERRLLADAPPHHVQH